MSSFSYVLYICPTNVEAREFYSRTAAAYNARPYEERDAGFDLYCANMEFASSSPNEKVVERISQNCSAAFYDTERGLFRAFWLLPRSSISRTSLRLANSVGLIDAGYRGTIQAATEWTSPPGALWTSPPSVDHEVNSAVRRYQVHDGDRYFQLASPDLLPWSRVEIVDTIPGGPTLRGTGGFGSTGVHESNASGTAAHVDVDLSGVPVVPAGGAGVTHS